LPRHVFSPKLQRTYQCIRHRARALIAADAHAAAADGSAAAGSAAGPADSHADEGASSVLPPPDARFTAPLLPDPVMTRRAAAAVDAFAALCPLDTSGSSVAGKRARGSRAPAMPSGGADTDAAPKRSRADTEGLVLQLTHEPTTEVD
jgi:hypothetical protein